MASPGVPYSTVHWPSPDETVTPGFVKLSLGGADALMYSDKVMLQLSHL